MRNIFGMLNTAMITPFDRNMKINYEKAEEIAAYLIQEGSDGIVVTGTTGESATLSEEEKLSLYEVLVKNFKGKAKIIAGTGSNSTSQTVELSKKAEKTGVDGLMLVVPYYNKPPQEGLYRHFKYVAEAVSLPIILYNVPGRTGVNLSAETTVKLSEIDNIVGTKEASGDILQITAICEGCAGVPEFFGIYSGDDPMTLPVLSVGGTGVVSIASHLVGREIRRMIDAYHSGNTAESAALHQKYLPLFRALFLTTNPVTLKAALNMKGWEVGDPRLPLIPFPREREEELKTVLESYKLLQV